MTTISIGDRVWVPSEEHAWLCGTILSMDDKFVELQTEVGKMKFKSNEKHLLESCGNHVSQEVENLVDLDELSEGAILHHVRKVILINHTYNFFLLKTIHLAI